MYRPTDAKSACLIYRLISLSKTFSGILIMLRGYMNILLQCFLQPLLIFNHYRVVLYASNSTDVYAQALFFYRLVILVLMYVLTCMD